MTTENHVSRKVECKTRTTTLKRSASTTNIEVLLASQLNLRDSKSYSGAMRDNKSESSDENEVCCYKFKFT